MSRQLKAAAAAPRPAPSALPCVADLAAEASGIDWPAVIERTVGLWAGGHFDRGQALWSPGGGEGAYRAWQSFATRDLTPEIAGLSGFCAHVAGAPDTPERAVLRACEALGVSEAAGANRLSPLAGGPWRMGAARALAAVAGGT